MTELQSYGGTNGKQFWMDRQAMYHSLAQLALDSLSAPASEAYVNASSPSAECLQLEDEIG